MELHEWLQQLKDKTMSHLEVLMQKGDIQGPPYTMPEGLELTFLRKFIERQAAGIPHNPRLRMANAGNYQSLREPSVESMSSASSDYAYDIPDQQGRHSGGEPSSCHTVKSTVNLYLRQFRDSRSKPDVDIARQ
jgi:hypothetical protein